MRELNTVLELSIRGPGVFQFWVTTSYPRQLVVSARTMKLKVDERKLGLIARLADAVTAALEPRINPTPRYGEPKAPAIHRPYEMELKLRPEDVLLFENLEKEGSEFSIHWLIGVRQHSLTGCKVESVNDSNNELRFQARDHRTDVPTLKWAFEETRQ